MSVAEVLEILKNKQAEMTADLGEIVNAESPSRSKDKLSHCADVINDVGNRLLGKSAEIIEVDGWKHLLWKFGEPKTLLACHYDTVWPDNTIDRWPFTLQGGRATGPGVFDMKSGIVQGMYALATPSIPHDVALLVTADEEIGSLSSVALIKDLAKQADAVLILESGHHGAIKIGRKGVSFYWFEIEGKAAHAGLEPELGVSALEEMAHFVLYAKSLEDLEKGTTVNATVAEAGTTENVIPAFARVAVDARALSVEEQQRVDDGLMNPPKHLKTTFKKTAGGINRPPFNPEMSQTLFAYAEKIAPQIGISNLEGVVVGGGSDGNFTAAVGTQTLDGLGAVGDGAHAEGEWIELSSMPERAALIRGLVEEITAGRA